MTSSKDEFVTEIILPIIDYYCESTSFLAYTYTFFINCIIYFIYLHMKTLNRVNFYIIKVKT